MTGPKKEFSSSQDKVLPRPSLAELGEKQREAGIYAGKAARRFILDTGPAAEKKKATKEETAFFSRLSGRTTATELAISEILKAMPGAARQTVVASLKAARDHMASDTENSRGFKETIQTIIKRSDTNPLKN